MLRPNLAGSRWTTFGSYCGEADLAGDGDLDRWREAGLDDFLEAGLDEDEWRDSASDSVFGFLLFL